MARLGGRARLTALRLHVPLDDGADWRADGGGDDDDDDGFGGTVQDDAAAVGGPPGATDHLAVGKLLASPLGGRLEALSVGHPVPQPSLWLPAGVAALAQLARLEHLDWPALGTASGWTAAALAALVAGRRLQHLAVGPTAAPRVSLGGFPGVPPPAGCGRRRRGDGPRATRRPRRAAVGGVARPPPPPRTRGCWPPPPARCRHW